MNKLKMLQKEDSIKLNNDQVYDFAGQHLLASYTECDGHALRNLNGLADAMRKAIKASGATLLGSVKHIFTNHGCTMLFLLSESHASIHTYPEHNSCFVDLFTCGYSCSPKKFDLTLRDYLYPKGVHSRILRREKKAIDQYD